MKIIAAFKTHFDIGYTKLARDVLRQYSESMLDSVIETCEKTYDLGENRRYVWTMPAWPLARMLKDAAPEKREKAEALIRRGQLVPHGLPFTTHTEILNREQLAYGCSIAKKLCKKYGIPEPISAKMTDVPGHTSGLIDVLVKNGIKFLHLGCNPASNPPEVPMLFWWEDLSGNRVLTMYNKEYGSDALPPKGWKYPVWLAMQQTYDNIGPQGPDVIRNLEKEVEGNELKVGTMDDFYNEIIQCDLSDLPVVRGEIGDTWIHGEGSYPVEVGVMRRTREKLKALRKLPGFGGGEILAKADEAYENMLLFGEHTFGLDVRVYIGDNRRYDKAGFLEQRKEDRFKYIESSWDEQRAYARTAEKRVNEIADILGWKEEQTQPCAESPFKAELRGDDIVITMPGGKQVKVGYEYHSVSFWKMNEFLRHYLHRVVHWGLSDFGRDNHPENQGADFVGKAVSKREEKGVLIVDYVSERESWEQFGNAPGYTISVACLSDRVRVKLELKGKQASPMLEAGDMVFEAATEGKTWLVTKCGQEINPCTDIVKGGNNLLYSTEKYAAIDDVAVHTIDAPLLTFGQNGIFVKTLDKFTVPEKKSMVFNLFNNQWGTNFPLYTEGDMCFEFEIMELGTARKTLPLAKTEDFAG